MISKEKKEEMNDKLLYAQKYADAATVLLEEIIRTNNSNCKIGNTFEEAEFRWGEMRSTINLIAPILFCYYQSLELLLKGFVGIKETYKKTHDAGVLFEKFKKYYDFEEHLNNLLEKYLGDKRNSLINKYMEVNQLNNIKELYVSLRYPDSSGIKNPTLLPLQFPEFYNSNIHSTVHLIEELRNDLEEIFRLAVQLRNKIEKQKTN